MSIQSDDEPPDVQPRRLAVTAAPFAASAAQPAIDPRTAAAGWAVCRREWLVAASPEALWPFVSDTHRLNYDSRQPRLRQIATLGTRLPNAYRRLRASVVAFEEEPFEWVRPYLYASNRRFLDSGLRIFAEIRVRTELVPQPDGRTRIIYHMAARPGNWLGRLLAPLIISRVCDSFEQPIRAYDRLAAQPHPAPPGRPASRPVRFVAGGRERLRARLEVLRAAAPALADRLDAHLRTGDAITLARIRPYELADAWGAPRRAALELCLHATRAGLLGLRWEILCPLCRGAKERYAGLGDLRAATHCDSCNIDFSANFARSVEVVFTPNPDIRAADHSTFCVGGPQLTPHIVMQQLLPPGSARELTVPLEAGRYRLRALELAGSQAIAVGPAGDAAASFRASGAGWPDDERALAPLAAIRLENATADEQLLILERTAWSDQAATAAEVITLQLFRDLFADEALRPRERIAVGSLSIVFTDLRNSTRLYRELGDAVAFGHVLSHFEILKAAIAAEGGAIVKTIGDSVMAAFTQPAAALRAIIRAQRELARPPDPLVPLCLKAGIHHGPCIAVTLNDRLDYFGSTVNLAARLEGLSRAGDAQIVISQQVRADPEVAAYLAHAAESIGLERIDATVKGFEDAPVAVWRITMIRSA
ncbi:MAG TPA: DUF5939 domain-containing protein [Caulobacteraceae bacterium]|nr:DUF5939 domain-containing protein [Caulobacteraceae bacterium]